VLARGRGRSELLERCPMCGSDLIVRWAKLQKGQVDARNL
jgi:hypothetical protein